MSSTSYKLLDTGLVLLYYSSMSELSIPQMQDIMGWSWPTAYKYAQKHGRKVDGQWYIPYEVVAGFVQTEVVTAQRKQNKLVALSNGS